MLEAQDVAAQRGDARLFAGLSFALRPGTVLFVTGPNGSGKTTLLRIAAGLTQAAGRQTGLARSRCQPVRPRRCEQPRSSSATRRA